MTNVTALVQSATMPQTDLSELWDIYKGYANRSRSERKQMKRALTMVKDESLIDIRGLFALPEAWKNHLPCVAIAKIRSLRIKYRCWSDGANRALFGDDDPLVPSNAYIRFNPLNNDSKYSFFQAEAFVPAVPKSIIPWNPLTRRKLYTLFDADWKVLPIDPYLLERVNDHQFRIVGHWDITDKERQLMALMGNMVV